jgi:hypothetical protein
MQDVGRTVSGAAETLEDVGASRASDRREDDRLADDGGGDPGRKRARQDVEEKPAGQQSGRRSRRPEKI